MTYTYTGGFVYRPSDTVNAAKKRLEEYDSVLPDFAYSKQAELDSAQAALGERGDFSYDMSSDPLYRQYRRMYLDEGKNAYADELAKGSLLTGGYRNSYADTAADQAYFSYVNKLGNVIPELYKAAYDRYNDFYKAIEDRFKLLTNDKKNEFSVYSDAQKTRQNVAGSLSDAYLAEYDRDYKAQKAAYDAAIEASKRESDEKAAAEKLALEKEKLEADRDYKDRVLASKGKTAAEAEAEKETEKTVGKTDGTTKEAKDAIKDAVNSGDYIEALKKIYAEYGEDERDGVIKKYNIPSYFVKLYEDSIKKTSEKEKTSRPTYML